MAYYRAAIKLADALIERFYNRKSGAFFDTAAPVAGHAPLGVLGAHRQPLQDSPTPAGNPTAASALLRLEALSGRAEYREIAAETVASFAGVAQNFGLYACSYGLAAERLLLDPVQVIIVGSGPEAARLEATAIARYAVRKTVIRIAPHRLIPDGIPKALEEMLLEVSPPHRAEVWAVVCQGHTCLPPITTAEALLEALESSN